MNLQPRHPTTAHKGSPHTAWSPALSYASGTTSSYLSMPQRGLTNGLQPALVTTLATNSLRGDTTNLPVILFDPLDTDTDTDTDTSTDKENNNDND